MTARVLIVDDNADLRKFYDVALAGITVDLAGGGFELLDRATQKPYELIITDLSMPDLSGIDAVKMLRGTLGPNQRTTIFALTGFQPSDVRDELRRVGFDACLEKPIRPAFLRTLCQWANAAPLLAA